MVIRHINERWRNGGGPRIIAITANAMQGDRDDCMAAGMDDNVTEPNRLNEPIALLVQARRQTDAWDRPMNPPPG